MHRLGDRCKGKRRKLRKGRKRAMGREGDGDVDKWGKRAKRTEGRAAGDRAHGSVAISVFGRNGQFPFVAGTHIE